MDSDVNLRSNRVIDRLVIESGSEADLLLNIQLDRSDSPLAQGCLPGAVHCNYMQTSLNNFFTASAHLLPS